MTRKIYSPHNLELIQQCKRVPDEEKGTRLQCFFKGNLIFFEEWEDRSGFRYLEVVQNYNEIKDTISIGLYCPGARVTFY